MKLSEFTIEELSNELTRRQNNIKRYRWNELKGFIQRVMVETYYGEYVGLNDLDIHDIIQLKSLTQEAINELSESCDETKCDGCRECTK